MLALLESIRPGDPDRELALALDPERLPSHIAIIMDGNGRWARQRSLPRAAGHKAGVDPVRMSVECCAQMRLRALTLYAFSVENWKRPRAEVETLWRLLRFYLHRELPLLQENNIHLNALGRIDALPGIVRDDLEECCLRTSRNTGMNLNLAINYGGRAELVDAFNRILDHARLDGTLGRLTIDEETISNSLYTRGMPDPDLLIRTSGEMRVSNFLLWQIAYAELYVTDTLWPDFRRSHLLRAILDYQKRDRRFGGLTGSPEAAEERLVEVAGVPEA